MKGIEKQAVACIAFKGKVSPRLTQSSSKISKKFFLRLLTFWA